MNDRVYERMRETLDEWQSEYIDTRWMNEEL